MEMSFIHLAFVISSQGDIFVCVRVSRENGADQGSRGIQTHGGISTALHT